MTDPLVLRRARLLGSSAPVDLLLADGKVAATGSVPSHVEQVDLDGRWVLPGLWDQHVHVTQWALTRDRLDLAEALSAAQAVAMVAERLVQSPPAPGAALVGRGFRDALWPDVPSAALLDAVAGER
ncbi:amidohydrolase family protein, partial [Cellulomonas citrea]|uniref:amidohydrolase family protein n=1 Tax=Cellulomonas citrea TaxID=1909423 RepID=UPI001915D8F6